MKTKTKVIILLLVIICLLFVGCNKRQSNDEIITEDYSNTIENSISDHMSNIYKQLNRLIHAEITYTSYNENIRASFNETSLMTFNEMLTNFKVFINDKDNTITSANEITDENINIINTSLAKLEIESVFKRHIAYRISNILMDKDKYNVIFHLEVTTIDNFGSYKDNVYYLMVFTLSDDLFQITHCSLLSNFEELYSDKNEYYFDDDVIEYMYNE